MTNEALWAAIQRIERGTESLLGTVQSMAESQAAERVERAHLIKRVEKLEQNKWNWLISIGKDLIVLATVFAMISKRMGF